MKTAKRLAYGLILIVDQGLRITIVYGLKRRKAALLSNSAIQLHAGLCEAKGKQR